MGAVIRRAVPASVAVAATIAIWAIAVLVPVQGAVAAPNKYAPVCVSALDAPQAVMSGSATRLRTTCSSPAPRPLEVTALNGTASIDARGVIVYTSADGWSGRDRLTVTLPVAGTDGLETRVIVDVYAAPIAADDDFVVPDGGALVIDGDAGILANDVLPDAPGWMIQQGLTPPAHGELVLDTITGALTYVPHEGFSGTDGFLYRLTGPDDGAYSNVVGVTFHVG